jgi:pimeloyl-ACP methyl ester carboxylesterase
LLFGSFMHPRRNPAGDPGLALVTSPAHQPSTLSGLKAVGAELAALAGVAASLPLGLLGSRNGFDPRAPHPTPVILVHGLLGHPTNFHTLRSALSEAGVRNFWSFSYAPRIDYQRLAPRLARMIEDVCRETGAAQVDVVGHSLGGLVARYLIDSGHGARIRRLVTLGAPYYTDRLPAHELALLASHDPLVPPPQAGYGPRGRMVVVPLCGHVGLLSHPAVLAHVSAFLTAEAPAAAARAAA